MNRTDRHKQPAVITKRHSDRCTDGNTPDANRVIPFPAEPAPDSYPDTTAPALNSTPLYETMKPVLHRACAADAFAGCLVLELDGFREIEETFGHELVGELGALVEARLLEALRCVDSVCPVSHKEFIILLDRLEAREDAGHIAERLLAHCSGGYQIAGLRLTVKGRIGMALYPTDTDEPETLLRYARVALREACLSSGECRHLASDQPDGARRSGA